MHYPQATGGQPPPAVAGNAALWRRDAPRAHSRRADAGGGADGDVGCAALDVHVRCDQRAPGAARSLIAPWLGERVTAAVLETAQLLISELVTNSVRHSGACETDLALVRVRLSHDTLALEVEDPGRGGVIARRAPDLERGGGLGLNLVQSLSQRWGHERPALPGRTRVWAQLPLAAPAASAPGEQSNPPLVAEPSALATGHPQRIGDHTPPPSP